MRPIRTTPEPSGRKPTASGGRFGPWRTTSSRHQSTRTGLCHSSARDRARVGTGLRRLPPKAPPLASGDAGSPRGDTSWRPARGRPAPPRSSAGSAPTPHRERQRGGPAARCCCGPAPSPPPPVPRQGWAPAGRPPPPAGPVTTGGPSRRQSHPPPRITSGPEDWYIGPSIWARHDANSRSTGAAGGGGWREGRAGPGSPIPRAAHPASTIDCHPVQRQRCASRADSTAWRVGAALPPSRAARRNTMPGVQKPHWLAPLATKASTQRALSEGGRPSTVVTERPATRRSAVTHATRAAPSIQTVQHPHCPWGLHPSLTEWHRNCSRSASSRDVPRRPRRRPPRR